MKIFILTICLVLTIGFAMAEINENAGQYGYKFLNVAYGPISIGMAGRGVHSPSNPYAFILQPAAACENDMRSIGVSHSPWLVDTSANAISYSFARRSNHFGIVIRNLDYGDIENRDDTGYLIGHYNPLDVDVMANYAHRINPSIYVGMNLGTLYQKLNTATSLGLHTDLGLSYIPPVSGSKLSLAVRNLGISSKTNHQTVRFPTTIEADVSKEIKFGEQRLDLCAGVIKAIDENLKGSISAELTLANILSLRSGYKLNYAAESVSAGFGIIYRRVTLDYGYAAFSSDLTDVHSIGLGYQF